jgi:hypothetical protein
MKISTNLALRGMDSNTANEDHVQGLKSGRQCHTGRNMRLSVDNGPGYCRGSVYFEENGTFARQTPLGEHRSGTKIGRFYVDMSVEVWYNTTRSYTGVFSDLPARIATQ